MRILHSAVLPILLASSTSCGHDRRLASTGDAAVDASSPPTDAANSDAPLPLGCVRLPTWQSPTPKPSLPVTPKLLWRKRVLSSDYQAISGFLVRSGNQLAFSARQLRVFDLDGNPLWETSYPNFDVAVGGVSADPDGNYYQFADKLYSYDSTGHLRWSQSYPNLSAWPGGDQFSYAPLVRGNSDLFFRSTDGVIRRVDARTGTTVWTAQSTAGLPSLSAAGGFLRDTVGRTWTADVGAERSVVVDGKQAVVMATASEALWVGIGKWPETRMVATDRCLQPIRQVSTRTITDEGVVDLRERYLERSASGSRGAWELLGLDGRDASLQTTTPPSILGADGKMYGVSFSGSSTTGYHSTLHLYGIDGAEEGEFAVDGLNGNPTLGEDGVIHAVSVEPDGVYLAAFQTTSPGVADTPRAMEGIDNRRSGWPKEH